MTLAAVIAAALVAVAPACRTRAPRIARAIVKASRGDRAIAARLAAIVLVETGDTCRAASSRRVRGAGVVPDGRGCSVGPFQIYVPGCQIRAVRSFSKLPTAAARAVWALAQGRRICRGCIGRCRRGACGTAARASLGVDTTPGRDHGRPRYGGDTRRSRSTAAG